MLCYLLTLLYYLKVKVLNYCLVSRNLFSHVFTVYPLAFITDLVNPSPISTPRGEYTHLVRPQQLFQAQPRRNCPGPGTDSLLGHDDAKLC